MPPETDPIQFPRQIWQTVSELARRCLADNAFCPEQSRIENLRCVHFESEKEAVYGRQLWYFEAIGVDVKGRRHMLYGALSFSVQYGLLELIRTEVCEEANQRQALFATNQPSPQISAWDQAVTRFWVRTACLGVLVTGLVWCVGSILLYNAKPNSPLHSPQPPSNALTLSSSIE
jgi:hypothetical protein